MRQRQIISIMLIIGTFAIISTGCADATSQKEESVPQDDQVLLGQKNSFEREGKDLEEAGDFDGAIKKYRQAADLGMKIYGSDRGRSMAFMAHAYEKTGQYETALPYVKMLIEHHPGQLNYYDWQEELEALIEFKKTNDPQSVRNYIQSYIKKYQAGLPPAAHDIDAALKITRILALYDMIGDHDRGIQFIDMVLDWAYTKDKEFSDVKRVHRSVEAVPYIEMRTPDNLRIPNWRAYKWVREYLLVREAFEQDKANGTRGSATMALIRSDYFPW